jgi:uncharacterized protein YcbK (DUF882 family)
MLVGATGDAAPASAPVRNARVVDRAPVRQLALASSRGDEARPPITGERRQASSGPRSWAVSLPAIDVKNRNTDARANIRLYTGDGTLDRDALRTFMRVACSRVDAPDKPNGEVAEPLDPRLVQLVFRAAYHFRSTSLVIVSATRKGAHGKHGTGDAIDFQLGGVRAAALAAYMRTYPRAGVGIYTHPKTQYVHLDVRDRSYHWIDASPPGVRWREKRLRDPHQEKRDASYAPLMDLPEVATELSRHTLELTSDRAPRNAPPRHL